MSLTSWSPLAELDTLRGQMDRIFNQMVGNGRSWAPAESTRPFLPAVDVYTTGQDMVVTADLPGLTKDSVTVEVTEDAIHLSGEAPRDDEPKNESYIRCERRVGRFERVIPLPYRIKNQEAKATFRDGLLRVRAPLAEELKLPRTHKVRIETK